MLSSFRQPNPARPTLTLTRNRLDLFFGGLSLGSSALHPTLAGRVRVGSKPDQARPVDSPMSNDVQQMPFQILDLELPFYLRTLNLQFILCKKIDENAW